MCNENCNCNTNKTTPATSTVISTPETVSYNDYKILRDEYNNLENQLKVANSDLDEKILIITALEGLILTEGSQDLQTKMTLKLAEIFKKDIK